MNNILKFLEWIGVLGYIKIKFSAYDGTALSTTLLIFTLITCALLKSVASLA